MKKMAAVFVIAVLVPTLVLAWLAVRSLHDQEIVVHSQRAMLHKGASDALAADLNTFMEDVRVFFGRLVDDLIEEQGVEKLSKNFDQIVPQSWSQAQFGCVVTDTGHFLSPDVKSVDAITVDFFQNNRLFLSNKSRAVVYQAQGILSDKIAVTESEADEKVTMPKKAALLQGAKQESVFPKSERAQEGGVSAMSSSKPVKLGAAPSLTKSKSRAPVRKKVAVVEEKLRSVPYRQRAQQMIQDEPNQIDAPALAKRPAVAKDQLPAPSSAVPVPTRKLIARNVTPSAGLGNSSYFRKNDEAQPSEDNRQSAVVGNWSSLEINSGNLLELMQDKREGAISRFLQDGLHILLWNRHRSAPGQVFWAELNLGEIRKDLEKIVLGASKSASQKPEVCLALLNADGDVVAQTVPGFKADWKHPFVASEVGEILPHWEVAAYFLDPALIDRSAKAARYTIWLIVPILLVAIVVGAILIFRSVDYEMRFARKKTDFVSNVSHELKTPLTSIRMFSDLLAGEFNPGVEKTKEYSGIVSKEAAKLSRLINNLLDFSRMDRGDMPFKEEAVQMVSLTNETVDAYRMQLESEGCELKFEDAIGEPVFIRGDRDALSRVLLNLLSNAEKYGCDGGEIEVLLSQPERNLIRWEVKDRGPGIDRRHSAQIFDKFYRADESLSTGIQGTGLGLSIAQQIVVHHQGSISHQNRIGGGSVFTVSFPINPEK